MANDNAQRFYEQGADPEARDVFEKHRAKINDYVDQVTNPQRRDYIPTNRSNVAAVYSQMKAEAYREIAEHKAKRLSNAKEAISRNRKDLQGTAPSAYRKRSNSLNYRLASDEELMNRAGIIRESERALKLSLAFDDSGDFEAYLAELDNRPKLRDKVMPIVQKAFRETGAQPTDLDNETILKVIDRSRAIQSEGPGEIRVTVFEQDGETAKGEMPVKLDQLVDKAKLEKAFDVKL